MPKPAKTPSETPRPARPPIKVKIKLTLAKGKTAADAELLGMLLENCCNENGDDDATHAVLPRPGRGPVVKVTTTIFTDADPVELPNWIQSAVDRAGRMVNRRADA